MCSLELDHFAKDTWKLAAPDYHVVAILGSQSTGKSTLLNKLFGTDFQVMLDENRAQTTHGIWLALDRSGTILVMDVEGTDGRERGENQASAQLHRRLTSDFERKSALFSLAMAEVLVVNMWEHSVGLYHGANMSLLKTVFDVHLQLFQEKGARPNTTIIFVVRDYLGNTPQVNIEATLRSDMARIWESLCKPEAFSKVAIDEIFCFECAFLPHKFLKPEPFQHQADLLAKRFNDPADPNYLFKERSSKIVPADGFALYSQAVWEKIMANKDLDLPTQQELLAQYRCDEIAAEAYESFLESSKSPESIIESGKLLNSFAETFGRLQQACLSSFEHSAKRYADSVFRKKHFELEQKLEDHIFSLFLRQLKLLAKSSLQLFELELKSRLKKEKSPSTAAVCECLKESVARATDFFEAGAQTSVLNGWQFDELLAEIVADLGRKVEEIKAVELSERIRSRLAECRSLVAEAVSEALSEGGDLVWEVIFAKHQTFVTRVLGDIELDYTNLEMEEPSFDHFREGIQTETRKMLFERLREETSDQLVLLRARNRFDSIFRYDEHGVPRLWQPGDNLDKFFCLAKDEAKSFVHLISKLRVPASLAHWQSDDGDLELINHSRSVRLLSQMNREFEVIFIETKRGVLSPSPRIPWWIFALLIVLGWNEFVTIVSSPLYLFMALLVIGLVIIVHVFQMQSLAFGLWQYSVQFVLRWMRWTLVSPDGSVHEKSN